MGFQSHIAVDGRRVRPIGLHRNGVEAVFLDETPRDRRAGAIEFAGSVAGLAEQDHSGAGEAIERLGEGVVIDVGQGFGSRREPRRWRHGQRTGRGRRLRRADRSGELGLEPASGQIHHLLQRPGLFEQVAGARHKLHGLVAGQRRERAPVQADDGFVRPAYDEQGRRRDPSQRRCGEIRPAAAGDNSPDAIAQPGRRRQRRGRPGAGAEEAERKVGEIGLLLDPGRRQQKTVSEKVDVEDLAAVLGFLLAQQVEQQGGEAAAVQVIGDRAIAWAEPA